MCIVGYNLKEVETIVQRFSNYGSGPKLGSRRL